MSQKITITILFSSSSFSFSQSVTITGVTRVVQRNRTNTEECCLTLTWIAFFPPPFKSISTTRRSCCTATWSRATWSSRATLRPSRSATWACRCVWTKTWKVTTNSTFLTDNYHFFCRTSSAFVFAFQYSPIPSTWLHTLFSFHR